MEISTRAGINICFLRLLHGLYPYMIHNVFIGVMANSAQHIYWSYVKSPRRKPLSCNNLQKNENKTRIVWHKKILMGCVNVHDSIGVTSINCNRRIRTYVNLVYNCHSSRIAPDAPQSIPPAHVYWVENLFRIDSGWNAISFICSLLPLIHTLPYADSPADTGIVHPFTNSFTIYSIVQ